MAKKRWVVISVESGSPLHISQPKTQHLVEQSPNHGNYGSSERGKDLNPLSDHIPDFQGPRCPVTENLNFSIVIEEDTGRSEE